MSTEDTFTVHYPVWIQVVSLVGVPALTVVALWLMSRPIWEEGIGTGQFVVWLALGAALLYQCAVGWRVLPYLRVQILVSDVGLEVVSGIDRRKLSWSDLGLPKEYPFATTTRLRLRSGETLLWAFDNMKHLNVLKDLLTELNGHAET
jgi:hypothetical protein